MIRIRELSIIIIIIIIIYIKTVNTIDRNKFVFTNHTFLASGISCKGLCFLDNIKYFQYYSQ